MAHLNTQAASAHDLRADAASPSACALAYIQARFGRTDFARERMARFVQLLIDTRGFPAPYPYARGTALIERATPRSRWSRDAVDAWFAAFVPPATDADDRAERASAAAQMDDNARHLKIVRGGRAS